MTRCLNMSFRPRLESLEGRDLPSTTGVLLFLFGAGLQQQTTTANNDFTTLQNDVNTQKNGPVGANFQQLATTTNNDLQQLQKDFTTLKNSAQFGSTILLFAFVGGLDSTDFFFIFSFSQSLQNANGDVNNLPGQVTGLGNQTFANFPGTTINQSQNAFGFSSLALT
jgi:hypothetical protein